jgi:phasin family protein
MNEISTTWVAPLKPWVAPLARFNQFVVDQIEQWTVLRMESLKAYVDLGVAQTRVALKITDPRSLHEFADSQFAVLSFVGHRVLEDGRTITEWGNQYQVEMNRLARRNLLGLLFK